MLEMNKERLQEIVSDNQINQGSEFAMMARQLLAGMEQEPVGYEVITSTGEVMTLCKISSGKSYQDMNCTLRPVYAAPQLPQPVEPEITSEELDDELLEQLIDFRRDTLNYHKKEGNRVQTVMHGVVLRAMLELQERRAAMLHGDK